MSVTKLFVEAPGQGVIDVLDDDEDGLREAREIKERHKGAVILVATYTLDDTELLED